MAGKKRTGKMLRSVREKKFVKHIVQTQEIGRSAMLSGYSDPSYGTHLMNQPRIKSAIIEAMERAGIHEGYLAKKLKDGLEAVYPEKFSSRGVLIQKHEPDYFTRGIYWDKAAKVRGDFAPERHETVEKRILVMITPDLVKGLLDSGALTPADVKEIERLPLNEDKDGGKMDSGRS